MKKKINVFDYAGDIMKALDKGVLITTKADGKVDSMTPGGQGAAADTGVPGGLRGKTEYRYHAGGDLKGTLSQ